MNILRRLPDPDEVKREIPYQKKSQRSKKAEMLSCMIFSREKAIFFFNHRTLFSR